MQKVVQFINDNILWGIPMIILILGVGIYLTVRNRFTQIKKFPYAVKNTIGKTLTGIGKKNKKKGDGISQFEAFSTAIAGTVGTGNIVGVATAILSGGPGAVFWMWLSAFVGMFTNFAENVLGVYYRNKGKDGEYRGGPMYYISEGLGWKWLAILFSIFCMFAAFGMNMVQINTIADTLNGGFSIPKWVSGVVVAIVIALIIIGGIKRIGKITSYIIPFMCLGFILLALIIIFMNVKAIPSAFGQIFKNAFSFQAVGGGALGYAIMRSMRYGLARGIFSNEAGLGSSVIAHSASSVKEPVQQGLWGIFGVFLDTMVICTLTALVILTSGVYTQGADISGAMLSQSAFAQSFGRFGTVVFSIMLPLFAFTTILSWAYYGEKSFEFIFGKKYSMIFKIIYVALVIVGALTSASLVWDLADLFNGLMAIPNLIALLLLGGTITRITRNYFARQKDEGIMPMLSAYPKENLSLTFSEEKENKENLSGKTDAIASEIEKTNAEQ